MTELLPFVIAGLAMGSAYGLAGTGLVLTYKTSGIFNFGHGALATVAVYVFYYLHNELELSLVLSLLISVLGVGVALGLGMERLSRSLSEVPVALQVAATVGLILVAQSAARLWFGSNPMTFPDYMPSGIVNLGSVSVSYAQLIIVGIALAATAGLSIFFRIARLGVAMRGVVDDPTLLAMTGTSPNTVRRIAWIMGSIFVCLSGVLLAPSVNLDAAVLTLLVVQAFGAAAIGRFSNIPLTYVGGLAIGIASALITRYVSSENQYLAGLSQSLPYIVLFIVLIITPRAKLMDRRLTLKRPHRVWRAPDRVQLIGTAILLVLLVAGPFWFGYRLSSFTVALTYVILFMSLGLLVKSSNQVSLAHIGFAAIGCVVFAKAQNEWGLPWLLALIAAIVIAIPIGAVIALPALRLSGVFLALATFAFGLILETMFYNSTLMFGPSSAGVRVARPSFLGFDSDRGYYYLVLSIAVICAVALVAVHRSRLGRLLRGLGEAPVALETHGASVRVMKMIVFCLSAAVAALAGALFVGTFGSTGSTSFPSFNSLTLLVLLLLMLGGMPWYAVMGAFMLILLPTWLPGGATTSELLTMLFGVAVIANGLQGGKTPSLPPRVTDFLDRVGGRRPVESEPETVAAEREAGPDTSTDLPAAVPPGPESAASGLQVQGLQIRFGGHIAVDEVSLDAPLGRITGLIGPNGAGKTTMFNACSGLLEPTKGRVFLKGQDISSKPPAVRARLGLGRSFQRMQLFDSMSVAENIALGREAGMAGSNVLTQFASSPRDRDVLAEETADAMRLCGITHLADQQAGMLSVGQRRLVELARALAGAFDVLLLDEPSSGLDRRETEAFGHILRTVVRDRNIAILLVEHDMSLVMDICSYLYVLDFGVLIFEGTPSEVASSAEVRAAYLGEETPPAPSAITTTARA